LRFVATSQTIKLSVV